MFQGSFKGISRKIVGYTRLIQGSSMGILKKGVSMHFQLNVSNISAVTDLILMNLKQ